MYLINKNLLGIWDKMVRKIYLVDVFIDFKGNDVYYNISYIIGKKSEIIGVK